MMSLPSRRRAESFALRPANPFCHPMLTPLTPAGERGPRSASRPLEVAATAVSSPPPETTGLGTVFKRRPSQCSMRGRRVAPLPTPPTAQTSAADTAVTADSVALGIGIAFKIRHRAEHAGDVRGAPRLGVPRRANIDKVPQTTALKTILAVVFTRQSYWRSGKLGTQI
jgi:hypothetical protein